MLNKLKKLKDNKKGFTLIEMVVVLVIIAVLAAITVPVVTGYIEDANNARYISDAQAVYSVVQVEEARAKAKDETPNYTTIATTAVTKLAENTNPITNITITAPTAPSTNYTIAFTSGGKSITATINPNNEITVVKN